VPAARNSIRAAVDGPLWAKTFQSGIWPRLELISDCQFRRLTIDLSFPVSPKRQTDKSEHHLDGSGYHQPMRILQGRESVYHFTFAFSLGATRQATRGDLCVLKTSSRFYLALESAKLAR
jgi:hypothetical protein